MDGILLQQKCKIENAHEPESENSQINMQTRGNCKTLSETIRIYIYGCMQQYYKIYLFHHHWRLNIENSAVPGQTPHLTLSPLALNFEDR